MKQNDKTKSEDNNMTKILFVCLGNICRSPMAEFVLKDMVKRRGIEKDFLIRSAATSNEAVGCAVHKGTKNKLAEFNISTDGKYAVQLKRDDYSKYDLIIGMEQNNINDMLYIFGNDPDNKVYKLLDFANGGDIADPWYTHNFDKTYDDILCGCNGILKRLRYLPK